MEQEHVLISGSKDTFVKFWDLDTQHCFKTLTGHHSEVNLFNQFKFIMQVSNTYLSRSGL